MEIANLVGKSFKSGAYESHGGVEKKLELVSIYFTLGESITVARNDTVAAGIEDPIIRNLIESGGFISTSRHLSGESIPSDGYYALMARNVTNSVYPGRGGIICKMTATGLEPVYTQIGSQKFMLDIKGIGTPNGEHTSNNKSGSLFKGAVMEYESLLNTVSHHPAANNSLHTQAVSVCYRFDGLGQVTRAIASLYRPSFNGEIFDTLTADQREIAMVQLVKNFVGHLLLERPQIPENHWGDNSFWPDLNDQESFHLTDFMEIYAIDQSPQAIEDLSIGLQVLFGNLDRKFARESALQIIVNELCSIYPDIEVRIQAFLLDNQITSLHLSHRDHIRKFAEFLFDIHLASKLWEIRNKLGYKFNKYMFEIENRATADASDRMDLEFTVRNSIIDEIWLLHWLQVNRPSEFSTTHEVQLSVLNILLDLARKYEFTTHKRLQAMFSYLKLCMNTMEIPLTNKVMQLIYLDLDGELETDDKSVLFNASALVEAIATIF